MATLVSRSGLAAAPDAWMSGDKVCGKSTEKGFRSTRTYFQAEAKDLTFVVEWRCTDWRAPREMDQEQALALSRAVLWHAVESGEANRTTVTKVGTGPNTHQPPAEHD